MIYRSINYTLNLQWFAYLFRLFLVVTKLYEQVRIHVHYRRVVGPRVQSFIQQHDCLLELKFVDAALRLLD